MSDREQIIRDFEHAVNKARGDYYDYVDLTVEDADKILKLLKEQEQTIKSATWICHMYTPGSKRFECNRCRGAEWKPSDYCPDCGSRMDETVVNMDD